MGQRLRPPLLGTSDDLGARPGLGAISHRVALDPSPGPLAIATAGIWCLAGFVLLTAAWSQSPAAAWEEAARSVFYAAVWTLSVSAAADDGWRKRLGAGLVIGVSAVAVVTLIGLVVDADSLFLAGRLDSPVGYRNGTAALFAFAAWPLIGFAARRGRASGVRAGAFAAAALGLSLAFLTQSRGVLIGLALGGVVSLLIGPDRLRRAWLAVGAVGVIAALLRTAAHSLRRLHRQQRRGHLQRFRFGRHSSALAHDGLLRCRAVHLRLRQRSALAIPRPRHALGRVCGSRRPGLRGGCRGPGQGRRPSRLREHEAR